MKGKKFQETDTLSRRSLLSFLILLSLILAMQPVQTVLAQPAIELEATLEPQSIQVGANILLTVIVRNPTSQILEEFDIQIAQTGFKVVESKAWPERIEAIANLSGVYTLEAKNSGMHRMGLVATFAWTEDAIRRQGSTMVDVGTVHVEELPLKLTEQFWGGINVLIGGALGALITGAASYFRGQLEDKKTREHQRMVVKVEHQRNHERVKSLLLSELQFNERKITIPLGPELENWEVIKDQGLYTLLASNVDLAMQVVDLYVDLENYAVELNAGRIIGYDRESLKRKISEVRTLVEAWKYEPARALT